MDAAVPSACLTITSVTFAAAEVRTPGEAWGIQPYPASVRVFRGRGGELLSRKTRLWTVWWISCMQLARVTNPIWGW